MVGVRFEDGRLLIVEYERSFRQWFADLFTSLRPTNPIDIIVCLSEIKFTYKHCMPEKIISNKTTSYAYVVSYKDVEVEDL